MDLGAVQSIISNVGFPITMTLLIYFHLTKITEGVKSSVDQLNAKILLLLPKSQ